MNTPEQWRGWLRGFNREPEGRLSIALAAVDAFEALSAKPAHETATVNALVRAAISPHRLVFDTGCNILFHLAATRPSCRDAIERMASASDSTARFHAIAYLRSFLPEQLKRTIIERALVDRSAKVRAKAVERIEEFHLDCYIPRLEEMVKTEKNTHVLQSLGLHLPLLRDGFHLRRAKDGSGYYLTVRGPGSLGGPFVPTNMYSESYIKELVESLRMREFP